MEDEPKRVVRADTGATSFSPSARDVRFWSRNCFPWGTRRGETIFFYR